MQSADATLWIQLIGLGAILGALGQGIRAIVGLKKMNDGVSGSNKSVRDVLDGGRLLTSLLIGAIAGSLAAIGLVGIDMTKDQVLVEPSQISALLGAGYAGADFIEGFMNRTKGDPGTPAGTDVVGTGTPAALPSPAPATPAPAAPSPTPAPPVSGSADQAVG